MASLRTSRPALYRLCYTTPDRGRPGSACILQGWSVHNQSCLSQNFKFLGKNFSHIEFNRPPGNISVLIFILYLYRKRALFHLKCFEHIWASHFAICWQCKIKSTNANFSPSLYLLPQNQPQILEDRVHIPKFSLFLDDYPSLLNSFSLDMVSRIFFNLVAFF